MNQNDYEVDRGWRGTYDRDYDRDYDRGRRGAYARGGYNDYNYNRTNYGRGYYGNRGPGYSDYDRGYYGRGGYGYNHNPGYWADYDRNYGDNYNARPGYWNDYERSRNYWTGAATYPTWTYTEVWMIPGEQTGRGPRGYERSDDQIKDDVCRRLTQHGQVDASDVNVQVKNCEVTLSGTVDNRQQKRMAEDAVDSVPGVKDVHNQLHVTQQPGNQQMQGNKQTQTSQQGSQQTARSS